MSSSLIVLQGEFLDMEITCPPELAKQIQLEFLAVVRKYPVKVRIKMIDILNEIMDYERDDQFNPT